MHEFTVNLLIYLLYGASYLSYFREYWVHLCSQTKVSSKEIVPVYLFKLCTNTLINCEVWLFVGYLLPGIFSACAKWLHTGPLSPRYKALQWLCCIGFCLERLWQRFLIATQESVRQNGQRFYRAETTWLAGACLFRVAWVLSRHS